MGVYVGAIFDSVDFADLASGRIRNIPGIVGFNIYRNKFAQKVNKDFAAPLILGGAGMPYRSEAYVAPFYPVDDTADFDKNMLYKFEPANRRDAMLKVETSDNKAAWEVSSILRNAGGRSVKIFYG